MSNEALLLLAVQGLLGLLSLVGLRWTASIKQELGEMRADISQAKTEVTEVTGRVDAIEKGTDHYHEVTDARLERVSTVASDLKIGLGKLEGQVSMCPNCIQPRMGTPRQTGG